MPTVVTLGAAYSANKGAAAMVQALVDQLPRRFGPTRIVAVSTHPAGDRRDYARGGIDVEVASQRPLELAVIQVPLAMIIGLLRLVRLPWRWVCRPTALRAIADADVIADISGISFVDGRRFPVLVYNALLVMVPLLLGRPVVKCSQAMGPFKTAINKRLARLVLPRLRAICPRGSATEQHLRELGLTNLTPAADLAFTMAVPDDVRARVRARLAETSAGPYLVVAPSQVVDTYCRQHDIDYRTIMADFIDAAAERTGHTVVMIAHSAQTDAGVNHMNDLPLCREIYGRLREPGRVVFFDESLLPTELRAIIAEGSLLVTSRFHAMISALTENTPLLVIGWSHKYAEVLAPFGLEEYALTYADLESGPAILDRTAELLKRSEEFVAAVAAQLPATVAAAEANFAALAAAGLARDPDGGAGRAHPETPPEKPSGGEGSGRSKALLSVSTVLGIGLAIGGGVFVVEKIVAGWSDYGAAIAKAQWAWLVVGFALACLGMTTMSLVWRHVIAALGGRAGRRQVFAWYQLGNLAKYLPGGIWPMVGRSELAVRGGIDRPIAYNSVALSMGATYLCASIVCAILLPFVLISRVGIGTQAWVFVLIPVGLAALHPKVLGRVFRISEKVLGKGAPPAVPPWRTSVGLVARHTIPWLINGLAIWFVALTFAPDAPVLPIVFAGILSWIIGFVIVFVPGGIGVREAAFTATASFVLSPSIAATVAIVSRLVFMATDASCAAIAAVVSRRAAAKSPAEVEIPR